MLQTVLLTAATLLTLALAAPTPGPPRQSASTAFVGTTVVSMTAPDAVLRNYTVVVRGERIVEMGPAANVRVPSEATIVDGRGKYLIPGLIDFHVHLRDSRELEISELIASGLTPFEALAAATRNAGRFFAAHPRGGARADLRELVQLGTVAPGAFADLMLLSGNPLEDSARLSRIDGVMTRGRWRTLRPQ